MSSGWLGRENNERKFVCVYLCIEGGREREKVLNRENMFHKRLIFRLEVWNNDVSTFTSFQKQRTMAPLHGYLVVHQVWPGVTASRGDPGLANRTQQLASERREVMDDLWARHLQTWRAMWRLTSVIAIRSHRTNREISFNYSSANIWRDLSIMKSLAVYANGHG